MGGRTARTGDDSNPKGSFRTLQVIDRLEVGPVEVTPRKVSASYRVVRNGRAAATELSYKYEEDVFQPGHPASDNLAALITAQVALNYGPVCREIRFLGHFDAADRRFLGDMAANTAREIYVKKFLEPNPFLRGAAARMRVEKRPDYLAAKLTFAGGPGTRPGDGAAEAWAWKPDRKRHAVLSSGGKDSLLTFGLLRELDVPADPIFINESGRHWFTALNGYRYLRSTCPATARVWTNSDRVFAWMLRQLPFIRPDFATLRSDEYPIRLWTVAVFLFGALPLVRKRGIGRVLIGDEFDTTRRASFRGIPHFDGLYDQSRFFDNALTRFYRRKDWGMTQFSILRPLSELLIEKILALRYPDLQKHQVSCHAAHLEGDRVHPCGGCEKCRRIVAMLTALGADPANCGYRSEQIAACLDSFAARGAAQESAGVRHLSWLLARSGRIPAASPAARRAGERAEIGKIRLDRERARLEEIPVDLRRRLLGIYMEYADGAVRRRGRVWVPFSPRRDAAVDRPNPFEPRQPARAAANPGGNERAGEPGGFLLAELTWPVARKRFQETDLALLPVGSLEQHGPHLPLDTDAWDADFLARSVATACSPPRPLVLPLIPYGVSYHHEDFSGTLSVSPEALSRMVYDLGMSAARHGITKLLIINGHGGNVPTLQYAAQRINQDAHIFTCVDTGETSDADIAAIIRTPNDVHAGEVETSTALSTRPHLVDMDKAKRFVPRFSSQYLDFSTSRSVEWYARTQKISPTGVLGDPTQASREKGDRIWEITIAHLVRFVESLKALTLDEIYQRKY